MFNKFRFIIKNMYINRLIKRGLTIGENFQMEKGCNIDANFPWLISIGNNVTMASYVYILAHDGSTKNIVGYSKVGNVTIGDNVFIGTKTTILPNVRIGNNVVIGANSLVVRDIDDNCVVAGNPAKVIMTYEEFKSKNEDRMEKSIIYNDDYTIYGGIDEGKKIEMKKVLDKKNGYII